MNAKQLTDPVFFNDKSDAWLRRAVLYIPAAVARLLMTTILFCLGELEQNYRTTPGIQIIRFTGFVALVMLCILLLPVFLICLLFFRLSGLRR